MKNLTRTLILTTLIAFGGVAMAGHGGGHRSGHGPRGPGHVFMKSVKDLNLTDTQREEIRAILDDGREDRKDTHQKRRESKEIFTEELLSDAPNAKRLHKLADDHHADMAKRMHDRINDMVAISAILTPEQKTELAERMADAQPPRHR